MKSSKISKIDTKFAPVMSLTYYWRPVLRSQIDILIL